MEPMRHEEAEELRKLSFAGEASERASEHVKMAPHHHAFFLGGMLSDLPSIRSRE